MANFKTHLTVGATSGGVTAAYFARDERPIDALAEILGGAIAGGLGSMIPDLAEPAVSSWHRSTVHSYTVGIGLPSIGLSPALAFQQRCRGAAEHHRQLAAASRDGLTRFKHQLAAFLWHLLSGGLIGALAGFVSHLVLDAGTPRGLPVIA